MLRGSDARICVSHGVLPEVGRPTVLREIIGVWRCWFVEGAQASVAAVGRKKGSGGPVGRYSGGGTQLTKPPENPGRFSVQDDSVSVEVEIVDCEASQFVGA